jgi:hypothetical protein
VEAVEAEEDVMARGRPGKGEEHVDGLEGPEVSKARMKAILQTVSGTRTVKEAAGSLGLSEARFHALRQEKLQAWLDELAPRPPGRPPQEDEAVDASEVALLREQVKELQLDLQVARTRTELALTMPHVLKEEEPETGAGKRGGPKRGRIKPPWFGGTTKDT